MHKNRFTFEHVREGLTAVWLSARGRGYGRLTYAPECTHPWPERVFIIPFVYFTFVFVQDLPPNHTHYCFAMDVWNQLVSCWGRAS